MDLDRLTDEVLERCDILAKCSEEPGKLTRTFLSPRMRDVHNHLRSWMTAAGLDVRIDAVGNVIGRRPGRTAGVKVFVVGSHVDTVPDAGKYDGVLGVMLGIAAAQALTGHLFNRTLDVIAFSEEEGVRFRTPYLGSLAVCGRLTPDLLARKDATGLTLAEAIRAFGLDPAAIPAAAYRPGEVAGYFEAHIEQGTCLDTINWPLGFVSAIAGQSRCRIKLYGRAGHAGAHDMSGRRDALAGAAEVVTLVEKYARERKGLRATVGHLVVTPGAVNVIPGVVDFSLDVRDALDGVRDRAVSFLLDEVRTIAKGRGLDVQIERSADQSAVPMDAKLLDHLRAAVVQGGITPIVLDSGAGHDAAVMASICPTAMLFLRSPGGISHHPDESVRREDVRAALDVIVRFLTDELDRDD